MLKYQNKCLGILKTKNFKGVKSELLTKQKSLFNCQHFATASTATQPDATQEWKTAKPYEDIPTMNTFTMMKNFLPGGKYGKLDSSELMLAFRRDFGVISKMPGMFGQAETVFTHNVEDFEKIFRTEGIWPTRPGLEALNYHQNVHRADFFQGVGGILATHGEKWGTFRSAANPILMQPKNVKLYLHKMSEVNKEFIARIREIRDPVTLEVPATFEEEINRWTFESVSVVALDKQMGIINKNRDDPVVKQMFESLNEFLEDSLEIELKPSLWRYYKTPTFNKLMKSLDTLLDITNTYINEAIERIEQDRKNGKPEKPDSEKSVLEKLVNIDKRMATAMAMDMLMAGVDTTSSTLTGFLLCMAKYPEKQQNLREEIMKILPRKDSEFDENSIREMPYLRACFKESLRVYPLFIGIARVAAADVVLSGYRIPKGTNVDMITASFIDDDTLYPRAKEYLPERWLRAKPETKNASECPHSLKATNPFTYIPFGFGPRSCIGRRIAEMELELCAVRMLRNFQIEFNYSTDKAFKSQFISTPNIPLKFKFTEIEN